MQGQTLELFHACWVCVAGGVCGGGYFPVRLVGSHCISGPKLFMFFAKGNFPELAYLLNLVRI